MSDFLDDLKAFIMRYDAPPYVIVTVMGDDDVIVTTNLLDADGADVILKAGLATLANPDAQRTAMRRQ